MIILNRKTRKKLHFKQKLQLNKVKTINNFAITFQKKRPSLYNNNNNNFRLTKLKLKI